MGDTGDLFQEWRTADRNAYPLEQSILRASMSAIESSSAEMPISEERDKAKRMRATANDLFSR
jgi:hypothetical protein